MKAYIDEPKRMPFILRLIITLVEKRLKKRMTPARMLAWYPKALIGAGVMESLIAHDEKEIPKRLLQLLRIQVSISASCPFCIDMNSNEYEDSGITEEELKALQGIIQLEDVKSLSDREKLALRYAQSLSVSPIQLSKYLIEKLKKEFSERGIIIIASTIAQVNFWTRFIQGVGLPPLMFNEKCKILNLENYNTLDEA